MSKPQIFKTDTPTLAKKFFLLSSQIVIDANFLPVMYVQAGYACR